MKLKSYLFLFFLGFILAFILGVRYGQRVEKTNKAIDCLLSTTPKITPTAQITPITPTNSTKSAILKP